MKERPESEAAKPARFSRKLFNFYESSRSPYTLPKTRTPGPADYDVHSANTRQFTISSTPRCFDYQRSNSSSLIGPGKYNCAGEFAHKVASASVQISRYNAAMNAWSLAVAGLTADLESEPNCQTYQRVQSWRKPKSVKPQSERKLDQVVSRDDRPGPDAYNVQARRVQSCYFPKSDRNLQTLACGNPFLRRYKYEYASAVGDYSLRGLTQQGRSRSNSGITFSKYGRYDRESYIPQRTLLTESLRLQEVNE